MHHIYNFELGDHYGVLILHCDPNGNYSREALSTYELLKNYNIGDIILTATIDECHSKYNSCEQSIYINKEFVRNIRFTPYLYLHTKRNGYICNVSDSTIEKLLLFVKTSIQKEILHYNIEWTTQLHYFWPNKEKLNKKIETLLLISKKRNSNKYDYVNYFVKGICMEVIKYTYMFEKNDLI